MSQTLGKLFYLLTSNENLNCAVNGQEELFRLTDDTPPISYQYEESDILFITNYFSGNLDFSILDEPARLLCELSPDAFNIFIHAWMSGLPIEKEILNFGRKIISSAKTISEPEKKRKIASETAVDRSDTDTLSVLNAAEKVQFEIHRMLGFLRFSPDTNGVYIARCAPDHLVVPALGEYLSTRFGETAWAVIDEKRFLCLSRQPPEQAKIFRLETSAAEGDNPCQSFDEWEGLWKHYHKTINNESRKNTGLQRQFMPKRYWKYLPEV